MSLSLFVTYYHLFMRETDNTILYRLGEIVNITNTVNIELSYIETSKKFETLDLRQIRVIGPGKFFQFDLYSS